MFQHILLLCCNLATSENVCTFLLLKNPLTNMQPRSISISSHKNIIIYTPAAIFQFFWALKDAQTESVERKIFHYRQFLP